MRVETPIFLQRILEAGRISRADDPEPKSFIINDDIYKRMAEELDRVIDQVTGTDASVTVSDSMVCSIREHFDEFELRVLNQLTTDVYYEALKTDDRQLLSNPIATELARPLEVLREKIASEIDHLPAGPDDDIPF